MTNFVISRNLGPTPRVPMIGHTTMLHTKMFIATENLSTIFRLPYAPVEVSMSDVADEYVTQARPGRTPLLLRSASRLERLSMTFFIGSTSIDQSVETQLKTLRDLSRSDSRLIVSYNSSEDGLWRITDYVQKSTARVPVTNEISRADVTMEFMRASDEVLRVGPISGGVLPPSSSAPKPSPAPSRPPVKKTSPAPKPRYYIVKRGDTLTGIAVSQYHDYGMWRKIADANHLRDPDVIFVGQKLVLP